MMPTNSPRLTVKLTSLSARVTLPSAPYTFSRCATSSTGVAMCVVCIPSPFLQLVYGIYSRKKTSRLPSIWLTLALPLCKVRVATLPRVDVERGLLLKTVHVAAGIIRKEGSDELLAVQRGYGDMQGLWEFPGGKLMRGESPRTPYAASSWKSCR